MLRLEWAVTALEKALGVVAESFLKSSVRGAREENKMKKNPNKMLCVFLTPRGILMHPRLEYSVKFWSLQHKKNVTE